jgi:hypothetical protein
MGALTATPWPESFGELSRWMVVGVVRRVVVVDWLRPLAVHRRDESLMPSSSARPGRSSFTAVTSHSRRRHRTRWATRRSPPESGRLPSPVGVGSGALWAGRPVGCGCGCGCGGRGRPACRWSAWWRGVWGVVGSWACWLWRPGSARLPVVGMVVWGLGCCGLVGLLAVAAGAGPPAGGRHGGVGSGALWAGRPVRCGRRAGPPTVTTVTRGPGARPPGNAKRAHIRVLRGHRPSALVAGTGFEPATSGL